jgi:hypothetical protein
MYDNANAVYLLSIILIPIPNDYTTKLYLYGAHQVERTKQGDLLGSNETSF